MKKRYNKSRRELFCHGCAYANSDVGFPGRPGMMALNAFAPCHFCMRNPAVQDAIDAGDPLPVDQWPDGSPPVALPMDCYMSADMWDQMERWQEDAIERETKTFLRSRVREIAEEYGAAPPYDIQ